MAEERDVHHHCLDGMVFRCKITDKAYGISSLDPIRFEDGEIRTDAFGDKGFSSGGYYAKQRHGLVEFTSEMRNPDGHILKCKGVIQEEPLKGEARLDATATVLDMDDHVQSSFTVLGFTVAGRIKTAA